MIRDARFSRDGERLEADVCVIGAGPAGITVALALIGSGLQVVLLEAGLLEPDVDNQRLATGELAGLPYYPLKQARARAFGGTAHYWNIDLGSGARGLRLRRLDEIDVEVREWIPYSGWPFGLTELAPYYERAEALFGIGGQGYDRSESLGDGDPIIGEGSPLEATIFRFGRSNDIIGQQGVLSATDSITVILGAIATRLEWGSGGAIARVHAKSLAGNDFTVEARAFVLAAGGIENARLLLLSSREKSIGNERGLVGRFFMEHPHSRAGFLVVSEGQSSPLVGDIHDIDGSSGEPWFRIRDEVASARRVGNVLIALRPVTAVEMRRALAAVVRTPAVTAARALASHIAGKSKQEAVGRLAWTALSGGHQIVRAIAAKVSWLLREPMLRRRSDVVKSIYRIDVVSEQFPNPESRVSLGSSLDLLGLPKPRLTWNLTAGDSMALQRAYAILVEQIERTQIGRFVSNHPRRTPPVYGGYHHMGTTRMSLDESEGVADADGKVYGTTNLYVAGSSVFPTSGVSNPTLTIVALSYRLGDHLIRILES